MAAQPHELIEQPTDSVYPSYSQIISAFGALGVASQNYPAVVLFLQGLTTSSSTVIHSTALMTGGLASGLVNFWMNVELLNGFFSRMKKMQEEGNAIYHHLDGWGKFIYTGGILIFVITGLLFGLMAFAFAMTGPLATLSIVSGLLVALIMTIQEVETWLLSYDEAEADKSAPSTVQVPLIQAELIGKWCGHLIAVGNVIALSLLFTLGLAQMLIGIQVAAFTALMIGLTIAFTFGAFTEFFFYNAYLADFCQKFDQNYQAMLDIPHAWIGMMCISINALVNAALTYAGIQLLNTILVAASITFFPTTAIIAVAAFSAVFSGLASFILGTAFWIRQNKPQTNLLNEAASKGLHQNGHWKTDPAANKGSLDSCHFENKPPL